MSESNEKILKKIFSCNGSYGQVKCSFDNASDKYLTKSRDCSIYCPKMTKKNDFFQKSFLLQTVPLGT